MSGLAALILAGSRGPGEPLAVYGCVSHKALIEVGGRAMLERVVAAVATVPAVSRIAVSIERDDILRQLPGLHDAAQGKPLELRPAAGTPSRSVAAALQALGTPLLVTTADHALLQPTWIEEFLRRCPPEADICVALARRESIVRVLPETQRTYLRFADGAFSGCNLFLLRGTAAAGAVRFWQQVEAQRKHPLRMFRRLGPGFVLRYLLRRLSLPAALARLGELTGARAAAVELPFGLAAVDVDKPSDLDLVRRIVSQQ